MTNYSTFRRKTGSTICSTQIKNELVSNSLGTTEVYLHRTKKNIEVNLILTNKNEGLGTGLIYTHIPDGVQVGDYFTWKNKYIFLVMEQDNNVFLDKNLCKFRVRECNVTVKTYKEDTSDLDMEFYAVFIGNGAQMQNVSNKLTGDSPIVMFNDNDMLIYSGIDLKRYHDVLIGKVQWIPIAFDETTNAPIVYCTLRKSATTLTQIDEPKYEIPIIYRSGLTYEFFTEDYYFKSDIDLNITRKKDVVYITMPYNTSSIEFYTKENGIEKKNIITIK